MDPRASEAVPFFVRRHETDIPGMKRKNQSYRFVMMSFLTGTMMLAELIVGLTTGSLTLLTDAMHMLSDLVSLFIGLAAHRFAHASNTSDLPPEKDPHTSISFVHTNYKKHQKSL